MRLVPWYTVYKITTSVLNTRVIILLKSLTRTVPVINSCKCRYLHLIYRLKYEYFRYI